MANVKSLRWFSFCNCAFGVFGVGFIVFLTAIFVPAFSCACDEVCVNKAYDWAQEQASSIVNNSKDMDSPWMLPVFNRSLQHGQRADFEHADFERRFEEHEKPPFHQRLLQLTWFKRLRHGEPNEARDEQQSREAHMHGTDAAYPQHRHGHGSRLRVMLGRLLLENTQASQPSLNALEIVNDVETAYVRGESQPMPAVAQSGAAGAYPTQGTAELGYPAHFWNPPPQPALTADVEPMPMIDPRPQAQPNDGPQLDGPSGPSMLEDRGPLSLKKRGFYHSTPHSWGKAEGDDSSSSNNNHNHDGAFAAPARAEPDFSSFRGDDEDAHDERSDRIWKAALSLLRSPLVQRGFHQIGHKLIGGGHVINGVHGCPFAAGSGGGVASGSTTARAADIGVGNAASVDGFFGDEAALIAPSSSSSDVAYPADNQAGAAEPVRVAKPMTLPAVLPRPASMSLPGEAAPEPVRPMLAVSHFRILRRHSEEDELDEDMDAYNRRHRRGGDPEEDEEEEEGRLWHEKYEESGFFGKRKHRDEDDGEEGRRRREHEGRDADPGIALLVREAHGFKNITREQFAKNADSFCEFKVTFAFLLLALSGPLILLPLAASKSAKKLANHPWTIQADKARLALKAARRATAQSQAGMMMLPPAAAAAGVIQGVPMAIPVQMVAPPPQAPQHPPSGGEGGAGAGLDGGASAAASAPSQQQQAGGEVLYRFIPGYGFVATSGAPSSVSVVPGAAGAPLYYPAQPMMQVMPGGVPQPSAPPRNSMSDPQALPGYGYADSDNATLLGELLSEIRSVPTYFQSLWRRNNGRGGAGAYQQVPTNFGAESAEEIEMGTMRRNQQINPTVAAMSHVGPAAGTAPVLSPPSAMMLMQQQQQPAVGSAASYSFAPIPQQQQLQGQGQVYGQAPRL